MILQILAAKRHRISFVTPPPDHHASEPLWSDSAPEASWWASWSTNPAAAAASPSPSPDKKKKPSSQHHLSTVMDAINDRKLPPELHGRSNAIRFCACSCLMNNKSKVKKEIDGGSLATPPRKGGLKFAPKVPPKKAAKIVPKTEPAEEVKDETIHKELLMKLKTSQNMDPFARRVKTEKKAEIRAQVAFGQGNSSYARSFPKPSSYSADGSAPKVAKEYAEPWDYTHSDYPVTLPLRRPYSGNPEIIDEEEFGESSASRAQDGGLTAAEELGLMDRSDTPQLLFFQMPASLPLPKKPESVAEPNTGSEENAEPASTSSKVMREETRPPSLPGAKLKELPGGFMGKILVYKSGKVKMKIGDALFDVSPGSNCMFVQEVAVINTREKYCCTLGEVGKRAVVTPDVDYLLDSIDKMEE